jgi:hypothetical protein
LFSLLKELEHCLEKKMGRDKRQCKINSVGVTSR